MLEMNNNSPTRRKIATLCLITACLVATFATGGPVFAQESSITKESIVFEDVLIGGTMERTFEFTRNDNAEQEYFIEITGEGATFLDFGGDRFTMKEDQTKTLLTYTLDTEDASNDQEVRAIIEIYTQAPNQDKEIVHESLFEISFTHDRKEDYFIEQPNASQEDPELNTDIFHSIEKSEDLSFFFVIQNKGNVDSTLDEVHVAIVSGEVNTKKINQKDIVFQKTIKANELTQAKPFGISVNEITLPQHQLEHGIYTGVVTFFENDKQKAQLGNTFTVFPDNSGGMFVLVKDIILSSDTISAEDPLSINVELTNAGVVDVEPTVHIKLNKDAALLKEKDITNGIIAPGDDQNYLVGFKDIPDGKYVVRMYATYGTITTPVHEQEITVAGKTGTVHPGAVFIVVAVLIFIVILTAISGSSKRKRRKKRSKKPYKFV